MSLSHGHYRVSMETFLTILFYFCIQSADERQVLLDYLVEVFLMNNKCFCTKSGVPRQVIGSFNELEYAWYFLRLALFMTGSLHE